ncbi:MAG: purine-nucleoside phosphorylase [Bacteroidetes bacterium]|nr:purine-nucleoside phosphorylase [Bacteroidota bacterium]
MESDLSNAIQHIRSITSLQPKVAVVLGSGLGNFASLITPSCILSTTDIPGYPQSSVAGHAGRLIFGTIQSGDSVSPHLLVFQGRVHFYECGSLELVTYPIRIASSLGVRLLILTNAAGGINSTFKQGDIMAIHSFINFSFLSIPTVQDHQQVDRTVTLRYPDQKLYKHLISCAREQKLPLREGTYCWVQGPSYETAAEIKMLKILGADAVGMSTVPEILTALQLKMKVCALSLISNLGTGLSHAKLSHQEVTEAAERAKDTFVPFLKRVLLTLNHY